MKRVLRLFYRFICRRGQSPFCSLEITCLSPAYTRGGRLWDAAHTRLELNILGPLFGYIDTFLFLYFLQGIRLSTLLISLGLSEGSP